MTEEAIDAFVKRWAKAGGSERANYQIFLTELSAVLGIPQPEPAGDDTRDNGYVFERRVSINQPDGTTNNGFIDLYKRGCFVLEAKQTGKLLDSGGWDKAMLKAHNQADQYARALPVEEGRPPFIVIVDVGRNIELYAEFSRSGATYTPFPDPRSHRIRLSDLHKEDVRARLKAVWLDPLSLDPSRHSARVTRQIADQLAQLARSLELDKHEPQHVAGFLMRSLFTMFAEDVGLIPERSFTDLLKRLQAKPESFVPMLENLWQTMNSGGFSPILESTLMRFNGGLFADPRAIKLDRDQMELLRNASAADWKSVEPAIFGTLLERALDADERHKLGAHFTPRAYVERLVLPTVIEPLRAEWKEVQVAALAFEQQGKLKQAIEEIRGFHRHLCSIRVLDPACGSGNFLYVTLEHMKRLEGEVLGLLHDLGESQGLLELEGVTVDPHQFVGLEVNPRAAKIAEIVLWIGYLQWHYRTHGTVNPPEPVLRDFKNIENRDALITYSRRDAVIDSAGNKLTRWDGKTYKTSALTGEQVPDDTVRTEQYQYVSPKRAEWPKADYIVGNPPFIGASTMRRSLGDGYVDAVRKTWPEVPESADFVMYWWHIAAETVRAGRAERFGFITTNSIKQTFNRRVIQAQFDAPNPIFLSFAIPDHPWVDSTDGAAVRIAMTVGALDGSEGRLLQVRDERSLRQDEVEVNLYERQGCVHADLQVGANVAGARPLLSNSRISSPGVKLHGAGFIVTRDEAAKLGFGTVMGLETHIREYRNGRDFAQSSRGVLVIDLYGLTQEEVLARYPAVYQRILEQVKPERDHNNRATYRENWWLFGEPRREWRQAVVGLTRYIATVETTKHRLFQFLDSSILPDNMLVNFALDDAFYLGVLSSRVHVQWALAAGGTLEDRPRYNKSVCFERFPFPKASPEQVTEIREIAEQLDRHRKVQQAKFPALTMTGMYNVLEAIRRGLPLSEKEKVVHESGLISILREHHDRLDSAVLRAYGWDDLADKLTGKPGATTPFSEKPESQVAVERELLFRIVSLNTARISEESKADVKWLRPSFQSIENTPEQVMEGLQSLLEIEGKTAVPSIKLVWPKKMREQVSAVRTLLSRYSLSSEAITSQFQRSPKGGVQAVLDALEDLAMVEKDGQEYRLQS